MDLPKKKNIEKKKAVILFTVGLLVGSLLVYAFRFDDLIGSANTVRYPLLARRIQIDNPNDVSLKYTDLRQKLQTYINNQDAESKNISLYFEYLPTGVAININEKNESIAASLMKLPVVMNLYRASENGQIDLDKKVVLKKEWLNDEYGTLYQKGEGYELSIREAARLTLKDSDNTALLLIWDQLEGVQINPENDSMNYLDVEYGLVEDGRAQISARSYSSILKCLYLSCFNNNNDSQEMLEYLTKSTFNNRLTKYTPDSLKIAHKIGTYNVRYQSDCGIFYVPQKNYVLCVMVTGEDPGASQIIADISQSVYLFITESK